VASTVVDGEVVLVSGTDGVFYRLDPVASLIWTCLDGSAPRMRSPATSPPSSELQPAR
jgi:hypothetical protein